MPPKILIVDDEELNRRLMGFTLRSGNYEFAEAANGQEALAVMEREEIDLVILDLMMPVMDGFEALKRIKANPAWKKIPVVVNSALDNEEVLYTCLNEGASDFFIKPLKKDVIKFQMPLKVRNLLALKQAQDELEISLKTIEANNKILSQYVEELERKDRVIQREMRLARETQMSLLPQEFPEIPGVRFAAKYISSFSVSGDIYDVAVLPDGKPIISIVDVSGHGVAAALITTMAKVLFVSALHQHRSPASTLNYLNQRLCQTLSGENFITMFLVVYDPEKKRVRYSKAGHPNALLVHADRSHERLDARGTIMGIYDDVEFEERTITLAAGDRVYLFTDGAYEALNHENKPFGEERMIEFLVGRQDLPMTEALDRLCEEITAHVGEEHLPDDVTFVSFEVSG